LRIDLGSYYEIRSVKFVDTELQTQLTRLKKATQKEAGAEAETDRELGNEVTTVVEALSGTTVTVQDSQQNYAIVGKCGAKEGLPSGISSAMSEVRCLAEDGQSGRPIGNSMLLKRNDRLGLCEVEVWARPAENVQGPGCEFAFKDADVNTKVKIQGGKVNVTGIFRTVEFRTSDIPSDGTYTIEHVGRPNKPNENNVSTSLKYEPVESAAVATDNGPTVMLKNGPTATPTASFLNPAGNTKVSGKWVFAKSSSVESQFTYTVGVTTSEGTTTNKAWSSSVEDSMTRGWSAGVEVCAGAGSDGTGCGEDLVQVIPGASHTTTMTAGASGESSSSSVTSQESSREVAETLADSKEKSMTYSLPPGAMWQWEYSVTDACTVSRRSSPVMIKVDHLAVTENAEAPPCCIPGYFADPAKPHGACVKINDTTKSPCLPGCSMETCYPTAASGECDKVIEGLTDLKLSKEEMKPLMIPILEKCPTLTAEDVLSNLGIAR
jgi:hypothetical protein